MKSHTVAGPSTPQSRKKSTPTKALSQTTHRWKTPQDRHLGSCRGSCRIASLVSLLFRFTFFCESAHAFPQFSDGGVDLNSTPREEVIDGIPIEREHVGQHFVR